MRSSRVHDRARSRAGIANSHAHVPLLIYDGSCGFCTRAARWLERHAVDNAIEIRSAKEMTVQQLFDLGLTEHEVNISVWWIADDSSQSGHEAIGAALRSCGSGWRYLGRAIDLYPFRQIAPSAYRLIARNRHLLPGATPMCRVDAPRSGDNSADSEGS